MMIIENLNIPDYAKKDFKNKFGDSLVINIESLIKNWETFDFNIFRRLFPESYIEEMNSLKNERKKRIKDAEIKDSMTKIATKEYKRKRAEIFYKYWKEYQK